MDAATCDLRSLCDRVERLEKQNRRMRLFCALFVLTPVLVIAACQSRLASTVEAQKFILRDKSGKVRVDIETSYDFGQKGNPVIHLFDENGKELTTIGAGVLNISGKGESAVLLDDRLQFDSDPVGTEARLDASGDSPTIMLIGKGGEVILDSSNPSVAVTQEDKFQAVLGSTHLVTADTGRKETTSAASLVMSGKNGKILWRAPR
ncbi:MAG: hypothetical protein ACYDCM_06965 [Candidatus Acidiferrales bacterium]